MYELYQYTNNKLKRSRLTEFLEIKKHDVISFAGAGGKTSTIFALARELKHTTDYKILITTTTKMFLEKEAVTVEDEWFIKEQMLKKRLVTAGKDLGRKMGCFSADFLQKIISLSDIALIEADGAQRRPFKMPRPYEPVYLPNTTKIVYLAGMTALDKEIEVLSRSDILADFLHKQGKKIIAIEDPIEIELSSLVQTEINPQQNYRIQDAMHAVLRQDPDVIVWGEIRDTETAQAAFYSSLSGYLVITTLHANDLAMVSQRCAELGIDFSVFKDNVKLQIHQQWTQAAVPQFEWIFQN